MNIGSNERIKFDTYGPKGPNQFDAGVAGFEASTFRGCGVFTSAPFDSGDESDAVQMLQRSSQVGEFYVVRTPDPPPAEEKDRKGMMDLVIYDEEKDTLVRIPFSKLFKMAVTNVPGAANLVADGTQKYDGTLEEYETGAKKCEIVVARPFIEHLMMSAVLTVAGRDTGATLYGPAGMRTSAPRWPSPQPCPIRRLLTRVRPLCLRPQTCRSPPTRP